MGFAHVHILFLPLQFLLYPYLFSFQNSCFLFFFLNPLCLLSTAIMGMGRGLGFGKSLGSYILKKADFLILVFVNILESLISVFTYDLTRLWKFSVENQLSKCNLVVHKKKIK